MPLPEAPRTASRASAAPRIVLLTAGNPYGLGVVRRLAGRGLPFTVALQCDAWPSACFRARGWRRALELPVAVARAGVRLRRALRWRRTLRQLHPDVRLTGARNSSRMCRDLARLAPDVLVLAGVGIVEAPVLATARWGAINAHPGLLPWARGNGVVAHAVARSVAIGASVHRVDPGIDTGPVLRRRLLAVENPATTLATLELATVSLAADLLADAVGRVAAEGALPPGTPQEVRTPLCRWMEPAARAEVDTAVRAGAAARLFERWRGLCEPAGPPWELPPGREERSGLAPAAPLQPPTTMAAPPGGA